MNATERAEQILNGWQIGRTSAHYESGSRGAATISTGNGDHGGVSYGAYQLSTNAGTLGKYLEQSSYGKHFEGLQPATDAFNEKWRELARTDPGFAQDQHEFIKRTHYEPYVEYLAGKGIDLTARGQAVQDALWSTSVQYRPSIANNIVVNGLKDAYGESYQLNTLTDEQIVTAIQDYKAAHVDEHFRSSRQDTRDGVTNRIGNEKQDLIDLARAQDVIDHPEKYTDKTAAEVFTRVPTIRDPLADGVLKHGERGDAIETMQRQLNALGYTGINGQPLPATGYFGDHTDFALRAFQRDREIEVDGKAGPETRRELGEAINQKVGEVRRPSGAEVEPARTTTGLPWLDEAMSAMGRGDFDEAARITRDKSVTPAAETAAKTAEAPTATSITTPEVTTTPLALTIADPLHPQHFLYQQADKALGDQAAHLSPEERQRTVAAIAASAADGQFRKIDGVSMVTNREGERNWMATDQLVPRTPPWRAFAEVETARTQPLEVSTQAAEKAAQEQAERQQQHAQNPSISPSFSGPR